MDATNDKLHSLLFTEGRELVNIKFFPGSDRGLTAARLKEAAAEALGAALAGELVNNPPQSSAPRTLEEFLANA
jgi:hypothetical protein